MILLRARLVLIGRAVAARNHAVRGYFLLHANDKVVDFCRTSATLRLRVDNRLRSLLER